MDVSTSKKSDTHTKKTELDPIAVQTNLRGLVMLARKYLPNDTVEVIELRTIIAKMAKLARKSTLSNKSLLSQNTKLKKDFINNEALIRTQDQYIDELINAVKLLHKEVYRDPQDNDPLKLFIPDTDRLLKRAEIISDRLRY